MAAGDPSLFQEIIILPNLRLIIVLPKILIDPLKYKLLNFFKSLNITELESDHNWSQFNKNFAFCLLLCVLLLRFTPTDAAKF